MPAAEPDRLRRPLDRALRGARLRLLRAHGLPGRPGRLGDDLQQQPPRAGRLPGGGPFAPRRPRRAERGLGHHGCRPACDTYLSVPSKARNTPLETKPLEVLVFEIAGQHMPGERAILAAASDASSGTSN